MKIEALLGKTPASAPGRIALADEARTITYGALASLVRSEARYLTAKGGARYGLLAENGCGWVINDLALHHLKRPNVPLPTFYTPAQLCRTIEHAGIDTLITDRPEQAESLAPGFRIGGVSPASGLTLLVRELPVPGAAMPAGTTKITFTSGSTDEPKGVCLEAAVIDCVSRSLAAVTAPLKIERHLCLLPLATLLENIAGVYAPLRAGSTCIVLAAASTGISYGGIDPGRLLAMLDKSQPESLILVPELLKLLVQAARGGRPLPRTLRFVAVGGAPVSRQLLEDAAELGIPVHEGYGLTECTSVVCLNLPQARRVGSVGRPLPHAHVALSADGELRVRGAVMSGYLGDPTSWGRQELATGDLGEIDEGGYVHVVGRRRNVFISSLGRNVSAEWIERELTRDPAIQHAVACGEARPHAVALLACSVSDPRGELTRSAVERANARLPDYAHVRRWARFPEPPSLANGLLTANGRLRRERVLERFGTQLDELFETEREEA